MKNPFSRNIKNVLGIFLITITIATTGVLSLSKVEAANSNDPYTVLAPLPCIQGNNVTCPQGNLKPATQVNFKTYVQYIVNLAIALSAVTAVFMIVWGGFEYITSTIPGNRSDGKKRITNAIYGLVLVLASYIILRTIDPRLVQIPTTFVAPLNLGANLTRPVLQDFLGGLQSQTDQLQNQKANAVANLLQAQNTINNLQTDQTALEKQIAQAMGNSSMTSDQVDAACSDPEQSYSSNIDELCAKRANDINSINTAKNQAVAATSESTMLDKLLTAVENAKDPGSEYNNMATLRSFKNQIDNAYENAVAAMKQNSNPPDSVVSQHLDDAHQFALGMLQLQADAMNGPSNVTTAINAIQLGVSQLKVDAITGFISNPVTDAVGITDLVNSIGTKIVVGSYQSKQQNAMASIVNDDVGPYANNIKDPTLRAYLIQNANNVVASIGTASSQSGK